MPYDEDRILTEKDFQALKEGIGHVADASKDLAEGVKALQAVIDKCCVHRGAAERRAS